MAIYNNDKDPNVTTWENQQSAFTKIGTNLALEFTELQVESIYSDKEIVNKFKVIGDFELLDNESQFQRYIKDAKRILDAESKELNIVGIKRLLAALLYEALERNNYGKDNE